MKKSLYSTIGIVTLIVMIGSGCIGESNEKNTTTIDNRSIVPDKSHHDLLNEHGTWQGTSLEQERWQTYVDDTYDFTLRFPSEWNAVVDEGDEYMIDLGNPESMKLFMKVFENDRARDIEESMITYSVPSGSYFLSGSKRIDKKHSITFYFHFDLPQEVYEKTLPNSDDYGARDADYIEQTISSIENNDVSEYIREQKKVFNAIIDSFRVNN